MPRGVYARKSAQRKTAVKAQPTRKVQALASAAAEDARDAQPKADELQRQFSRDDFRRSVDDMGGALLKAYARSIGIQQRDVDGLTEDRLRQNCKARILASMED